MLNLAALRARRRQVAQAIAQSLNLDAASSIFIATQLQDIETTLYETPTEPLTADKLVPPQKINPGALEWGFDRMTAFGMAKFMNPNATDAPRVNASKVRVTFPVKLAELDYSYTHIDLMAAAMANVPLDNTLAKAARTGCDARRNIAWLIGDTEQGMTGLFNDPNVPRANFATGTWATATADQILADLNELANAVWIQTRETAKSDVIVIPPLAFARINSLPRASTSDTTVRKFFEDTNPGVTIEMSTYLNGIGAGATNRAMAYRRNADTVSGPVSVLFDTLDPQKQGMQILVVCFTRFGGVSFKAPVNAVYRDGL